MIRFSVAGDIALESPITITNPNVTVDGDGVLVTIKTNGREFTPIIIEADNVTLKNLRVRPGPSLYDNAGDNIDGIMIENAKNVLLDHCSISWAVDENVSIFHSEVKVHDCIISEGLYNAGNTKGPHSCGLLIADSDCQVSVRRTLFAHNDYRNPVSNGRSDVVNNVIYAPGFGASHYNDEYGPSRNNYIGNVLRFSETQTPEAVNWVRTYGADGVRVYRSDNLADGLTESFYVREGTPTDIEHYVVDTPYPMLESDAIMPAVDVLDYVLANAGAVPRDSVDARIVAQVQNRTGGFVDAPL